METCIVNQTVGKKDGQAEQNNHPAAVKGALKPSGQEDLFNGNWSCMDQGEVLRKVKGGKSCQDTAKYEDSKEGDKDHGKKLSGQDITETFNALKIREHTIKDGKDPSPKEKACKGKEEPHPSPGLKASLQAVFEAPDAGFE